MTQILCINFHENTTLPSLKQQKTFCLSRSLYNFMLCKAINMFKCKHNTPS